MELRDIIKARKQHERQFAKEQVVFNGKIALRNGRTAVPGVFDHTWVVPEGESEPVAVYNRSVKGNRVGRGVQVGFAPYSTILEILRGNIDTIAGVVPTAGLDLQSHAPSHRVRDGDDPLYIEDRAIVILLVYPTGQSGLKVKVSPYLYFKDGQAVRFNGHPAFDISAHEPAAGLARFVLVYLDTELNTLGAVAGATAVDSEAVLPDLPDLPAGAIPGAFVRIAGGQTSFSESDFFDARDFLGGGIMLDMVSEIIKHRVFS
jgi:hypothetical protein